MPDWRRELRARAAALRLPPGDEAELIEELALHLEAQFADLAPRVGAEAAERQLLARLDAAALRDLGRTRRSAAEGRRGPRRSHTPAISAHRVVADLRVALRRARTHWGFTTVAVLSLALGIGANTAIFSLIDTLLLRRPPVPHRERLAQLYQTQPSFSYAPFSYPDYRSLADASRGVFSQVSAAKVTAVPRDLGDHVETLLAELVSGDYFPLLGLTPQAGRLLGPEDDAADGAHPVVVLSGDYWRRAFGGDPGVVGRVLRLAGRPYTIVGVAPADYQGTVPGIAPALYAPIRMINQLQAASGDQLADRDSHALFIRARLAPGVSMAQARRLAASFTADMTRRYPRSWTSSTQTIVVPETEIAVNPLLDRVLVPAAVTLMVVVVLVLLVACANLASFLLAQARDRRREIAIRVALGASRWALVRQLLAETLLLAAVGGACGVALAQLALRALLGADLPVPLPLSIDVRLDPRVLGFALGAAALAALLVGILPALQATRTDVAEVIKDENAGAGGARRLTPRTALVAGQIAVSLVLLITAALFLRSLAARERIDPGFGDAPAGMVWFTFPAPLDSGPRLRLRLDDIEARTRRLPGVAAVGVTDNMLLSANGTQSTYIDVPGFDPPPGEPGFEVDLATADSGFFSAAGIRVVRGRGIAATDDPGAARVAVINEVMARRFWPGTDPIGATFRQDSATYRVVGVTRTTKVRSLGEAPRPFVFEAFAQRPSPLVMLVARTAGDADATAAAMIALLRDVDPSLMVLEGKTMARHLATMTLPARLGAIAFGLFAALALGLAMIGVYGVVSYAVARRAREVGIRMALGADPGAIVRLLMREGLAMVVAGGVLGLALAAAVTRALGGLLSGVPAVDPVTFVAAPLLLLAVGLLATFIPARRSTRTDPVRVLRAE